jgi:hypothetical protein
LMQKHYPRHVGRLMFMHSLRGWGQGGLLKRFI